MSHYLCEIKSNLIAQADILIKLHYSSQITTRRKSTEYYYYHALTIGHFKKTRQHNYTTWLMALGPCLRASRPADRIDPPWAMVACQFQPAMQPLLKSTINSIKIIALLRIFLNRGKSTLSYVLLKLDYDAKFTTLAGKKFHILPNNALDRWKRTFVLLIR